MNKKLLLVEDNHVLSETLASILENEGYSVDCSYNGKNSFKLLKSNNYDALVIDYKLPDISGWAIVEKFHQNRKFPSAVMISAYADEDLRRRVARENILLLDKPFENKELIAALNSISNMTHAT